MLEPYSKLPWKIYNSNPTDDSVIINNKKEEVLGTSEWIRLEEQDLEYIIQSCNNFPKAIELLITINNHYNNVENYDWDKKENDIHKIIEEFLNSLK
jgi:hypothetical protein